MASEFLEPGQGQRLSTWAFAIYALNPEAFSGGLSSLRPGATLRIPASDNLAQLAELGTRAVVDGRIVSATEIPVPAPVVVAQAQREDEPPAASSPQPIAPPAAPPPIFLRGHGTVKPGETAYSIARKYRAADSSNNLAMWAYAIYALNPQAFPGDIGSLEAGARLRIPDEALVAQLWKPGKAAAERGEDVSAQVDAILAAWRDEQQVADAAAAPEVSEPPSAPEADSSPNPPELSNAPAGQDASGVPALEAEAGGGRFADSDAFTRASTLLRAGRAAEAEALLAEVETQFVGDPDFDYLYGVAILESGAPAQAIFPLQRAVMRRRDRLGYQLDLGRAYFDSGENETARAVFTRLRDQSPPELARQAIDAYLAAIDRRAARYQRSGSASFGLSGGFDSNANSATDALEFQGFQLGDAARSSESSYLLLDGDLRGFFPVHPRLRLVASGFTRAREYGETQAESFSTLEYGAGGGLEYRLGDLTLSGSLDASQLLLDGSDNNTIAGLTLGLDYQIGPRGRWLGNIRAAQVRYADELAIRDVDQVIATVGVLRELRWLAGAGLKVNLLGGLEEAVEDTSPNGRNMLGVNAGLQVPLSPRWRLGLDSGLVLSDYDGLFFGQERSDSQWTSELGLDFASPGVRNWIVRGAASYVSAQSDVELFEYDRLDVRLSVRRFID